MVSDPRELDTAIEFRVSINLTAHRLEASRLLIHADFFCPWVYADDTRGETFLEFFCEIGWYGFCWVEDDFGE